MRRPEARGFTLLEAIVALAILAAAGLAAFAAMSRSMDMLSRAERSRDLDRASRNALALLETVNFMDRPEGSAELGGYRAEWAAATVEPPRDTLTSYMHPGLYSVALYDVHVRIFRGSVVEREFDVRRASFRQVRKPAVL